MIRHLGILLVVLCACGDNIRDTPRPDAGLQPDAAPPTPSTLVRVVPEAPGTNCANGGVAVQSGLDTNDDHVLEDSEVLETSYVCNGPSGTNGTNQLVRIDTEPAGANCTAGGSAILVGPDTNANGTLDDSEVTTTTYVCNGANTVIRAVVEPMGTRCVSGGFAILSGPDTNGNGVLDDAEVSATTYACNPNPGPAPPVVRVMMLYGTLDENWPVLGVKAPTGTTFRLYADPACAGPVVFTAAGLGGTRLFRVEVPDNSSTTFSANVTSTSGTSDCAAAPTVYHESSALPPTGGAATCATHAGGPSTSSAMATAVASDSDGSLVVAGYFEGPFVLGRGELGETTLAATRGIYLARYRTDCTLAWAREISGPSVPTYASGNLGLAVAGGAITVAGTFAGTATFGPGEPNETTLTATATNGFIARFSSNGALSWVRQQLGGTTFLTTALALSNVDSSFFVTGWFNEAATFGPNEPNETALGSTTNGTSMFLARFGDDGSLLWVRTAGGTTGWAMATAVTPLDDGGAAITGTLHAKVTFGAGDPNETTLTSGWNGLYKDVIVVRYGSDGTLAWAKQAGNQGEHTGYGIAASPDGAELTVTGTFGGGGELGYIEFGAGEPNDLMLSAEPFFAAFVARFRTDNGSFLWARKVEGGNAGNAGLAVAATSDGGAIVAGIFGASSTFSLSTTFGAGEPNEVSRVSQGHDIFVARYAPNGDLAWVRTVWGPTDNDQAFGVAVSADDSATVVGRFRTNAVVNTAVFDTATFGAPRFSSSGIGDAFVARFSP